VFVSPDGFCSLRTRVPQCLVVHDLTFLHYPEFLLNAHLRYYKKYTARFLAKANVIATVSAFSKQDICKQYKTDADKIHVVYSATNPVFKPLEYTERENVKQQYAEGCEYFIFTGTIHPRKNLINLLRAFSIFKKKQSSNMKLVISGRMAWKTQEFTKLLSTFKFRNDVKLTGYVSKEELSRLVASAYAMVYPSFFEGFGVPPLEALQCHVPAIVSRSSALPEIGDDAYLYVDPESVEDIAQKMMLLYKDETLRNKLIVNGQQRLQLFSWDETAKKIWDCIHLAAQAE
jgi:glycosyltransferase involved in cell wall biosynthesis